MNVSQECNTHYRDTHSAEQTRAQYRCLQTSMVQSWRRHWGQGDWAFVFVQLAPYICKGDQGISSVRLGQADTLPSPGNNITTIGMAVAYDIGSRCNLRTNLSQHHPQPYCIHPHLKAELGRRIALATLHTSLSWSDNATVTNTIHDHGFAVCGGPSRPRVRQRAALTGPTTADSIAATKFEVTFGQWAESGLVMRGTASCGSLVRQLQQSACCTRHAWNMFQVQEARTGRWVNSIAALTPDGQAVLVTPQSPLSLGEASRIRFNINDTPQCTLYNRDAQLPAPPFVLDLSGSIDEHERDRKIAESSSATQAARHAPRKTRVRVGPSEHKTQIPPRGYNTWNFYHSSVDELAVQSQADALVGTGLAQLGYNTLILDGGWLAGRNRSSGRLLADPTKFPSGIPALVSYLRARGLKLGIHTAKGPHACDGRAGSCGSEVLDMETFCEYGISFVK